MNLQKEFRTLILPVLKGAPILIGFLAGAFLLAARSIMYSVPQYQSSGSIKIDIRDFGVTNFDLFNQGGISAAAMNNFLTELEVFGSRHIKEKAFTALPEFFITYHRFGKVRTMEMFRDAPFSIRYEIRHPSVYNKEQKLVYTGNGQFRLEGTFPEGKGEVAFGRKFSSAYLEFTVLRRDSFLMAKPDALREGDEFYFVLHSLESLAKEVNAENLFIKPVDKEIFVIKTYYQHEVPEKAAMFVNALMDAYIRDDLESKGRQAFATVDFIDQQLATIGSQLKTAEGELAVFKRVNQFTNPNLETDAVLKSLAELDKQKLAYDLQEVELNNVYSFLASERDITDFSPDFQAVNDAVFKESYSKLQQLHSQRKDLLKKYTPTSSEVLGVQDKIADLNRFIVQTIQKKRINLAAKKGEITAALDSAQLKYQALPEKERRLVELERGLNMIEQSYVFLAKKKTEVQVASQSRYSFHEILDYAQIASKPISPNKPLLYGVAIFMGLLLGLVVVYVRAFFVTRVTAKADVTERVQAPILATISRIGLEDEDNLEPLVHFYTNLNLYLRTLSPQGAVRIVIGATSTKEGASFLTFKIAHLLAHYQHKVCVVDMNIHNPSQHQKFQTENFLGIAALLKNDIAVQDAVHPTAHPNIDLIPVGQIGEISSSLIFSPQVTAFLDELKTYYDFVLIDVPPFGKVRDAVPLMHQADLNLYLVRAYVTRLRRLWFIDHFIAEYQLPKVYVVLNNLRAAPSAYRNRNKTFFDRLRDRIRQLIQN